MTGQPLSLDQKDEYQQNGYTIQSGVFSKSECDQFINYMMDLHADRQQLEGFTAREGDEWGRTHNQHNYDPVAMKWLIDARLYQPLYDCLDAEPDGIQTMYFWKGSEQRRHQDQFYLPGCISAWIALQDVNKKNGTIYVQPGSHRHRLVTHHDFEAGAEFEGVEYNDAVDLQFEKNNLSEITVEVSTGDVVYFHGVLVHRGGPIIEQDSFRHVLANHYIPRHSTDWHLSWPRHPVHQG